jgi:hypothetical protein
LRDWGGTLVKVKFWVTLDHLPRVSFLLFLLTGGWSHASKKLLEAIFVTQKNQTFKSSKLFQVIERNF